MSFESAPSRGSSVGIMSDRASRRLSIAAIALASLCLTSIPALAQSGVQSEAATVNVNAFKNASLTLSVTGGTNQTLAAIVDDAVNEFPTPVTFVTSWDVHPSTASFQVVASFSSAELALAVDDASEAIPSTLIEGSVATGVPTAFTPFTQSVTGGVAGAGLLLVQQTLTAATRRGTRTDDLALRLNLAGADPVTVGEYTGVITLRAITQ